MAPWALILVTMPDCMPQQRIKRWAQAAVIVVGTDTLVPLARPHC